MVGKRVRDALYVHTAAVGELPDALRTRLSTALNLAGQVTWNVARLEPSVVGLLLYCDFETDPFPALVASTRVELDPPRVTSRSFANAANPLILHRKELLASKQHPDSSAWAALTAALERRELFRDPHLIGRRKAWLGRLAAGGVRVEGHTLCPT
jgi:DNA phosphorothioation-associated putative methyltransferase